VLPELRDELHVSASVAALHGSLFGILLLVLATFGRRVLAAVSNRGLLRASVGCMLGGGVLFGFGRTAALTLSGAAVASLGAACLVIVVPTVVFAHHREAPTQALAMLNSFPMLSSTTLPAAVGLAVALDVTWRAAYLIPLALIGVAIIAIAGRAAAPDAPHAAPVGLGELFRTPRFARRWAVLACGVLVELATASWAASIMVDRGGASKGLGAALTVGFFIGMAIGRVSLTNVLRTHSPQRVMVWSFVGVLISLAPFLLGPGLVDRVIGLLLLGLTLSAVYPLSISRLFELHDDTEALGRATAIASGVGATFGPLLLGTLSDAVGLGWATVVLPVFCVVGLLMIRQRVAA
jgi:fucose permease